MFVMYFLIISFSLSFLVAFPIFCSRVLSSFYFLHILLNRAQNACEIRVRADACVPEHGHSRHRRYRSSCGCVCVCLYFICHDPILWMHSGITFGYNNECISVQPNQNFLLLSSLLVKLTVGISQLQSHARYTYTNKHECYRHTYTHTHSAHTNKLRFLHVS